jgi:hypothetical protein
MTNAALRMGDACVIINEIRSRLAIQGVINMLNTQPGIFLLYNLHAQSLKDIQDRLEMVFGLPAASMFSTDRYSFLKKVRFGRKTRVYRMLGSQYETDLKERKFVPVFQLQRGGSLEQTGLQCLFLENPEANAKSLSNADIGRLAKSLKMTFAPPALERRCEETGIPAQQYLMEAFFKGKLYSQVYDAYLEYEHPQFLELDFVLKCTTQANNLLKRLHEKTEVDWAVADREWRGIFASLVEQELAEAAADREQTGEGKAPAKRSPKANAEEEAVEEAPVKKPGKKGKK